MSRRFLAVAIALLTAGLLAAQDRPQRGVIKKVDADKGTVTITVDGKDVDYKVVERTRLMDGDNKEITDRLKDKRLRKGAAVMFLVQDTRENVLRGLRLGGGPGGPGDIRRARVKKLDVDGKVITLTVDGKDRDFTLTEETRVVGVRGDTLKERLRSFKAGTDVMFRAGKKDGKDTLVGIGLPGTGREPGPRPGFGGGRLLKDTSKLKPLTEMGDSLYQGQSGGLYPGGKNTRPEAHEAAGLRLAKEVRPLDGDGKPAKDGKIVLLSVGMSNTSQISGGFQQALRGAEGINPHLVFVNGAQGGMTAALIQSADRGPGKTYWDTVKSRLKALGLTRAQVQVAWIKQADAGPREGFPDYPRKLQKEQANIVLLLHERFPNLKLVYLSSRTYGGYATTQLNPEPYAYESGFAVKWLIEQQIKGDPDLNFDPKKGSVKAPWLSWGPYLWANGTTKRADGFSSEKEDFGPDGTHHAAAGARKMGEQLLKFFESDSTTKGWFLASGGKE
jgi:Cu/Ag efflux protein CusF